ncbi:non-classical arabinogalactan protein 31-like [Cucurbita maxima]|uniref:Non-classical arabinogalactan protein 31-like n=1 Tax=Cucurbita maxima TaxID=3661 RepID=A0A6J1KXA6_CUCMA|nr:non-classical arabinogalactan protein 31-like [Cucurbita maxima]
MDFALSKSFFFLLSFAIFAVSTAEDVTAAETLAESPHHYAAVPPAQPPAHHHHHHHHHTPKPAPVSPPTHVPVHPPAQPPSHHHHHIHSQPPVHPPVHNAPPTHLPVHPPAQPPSHHHNVHAQPPVHPPVNNAPPHHLPPTKMPAPGHEHHRDVRPLLPPAHSPSPMYPPKPRLLRSFISVQGVVYCKSCKYAGVDTLNGATPVAGASVKLICQNTKYPLVQTATTDKNGYFFINAPKAITSYAFHKCKVLLGSSPVAACSKPSALHGGAAGAALKPQKSYIDANKLPFVLYSVGPFAFEPTCPHH